LCHTGKIKTKVKVMAFQLDAKFFRRAKKVNRAVEITDNYAIIPAVKDSPEIRVPLPIRRPLTMEERETELAKRYEEMSEIEELIEVERKRLMERVKSYRDTGVGAADVVVQNLKVRDLIVKRTGILYRDKWIEEVEGLTLKDIFESKRDDRSLGLDVRVIKRRIEPIISLYVDLGAAADAAANELEDATALNTTATAPAVKATAPMVAPQPMAAPMAAPVQEDIRRGAIVAQTKRSFKLKAPGQ
jgi:hypothetical protein